VVAPWSCSTASCAVAALTQLAWSAAHAGTTTGLGSGVGEADALGVGLGLGDGVGVEVGAGVVRFAAGLEGGASGPFAVHAAIAARPRRRTTPFLTAP